MIVGSPFDFGDRIVRRASFINGEAVEEAMEQLKAYMAENNIEGEIIYLTHNSPIDYPGFELRIVSAKPLA